MIPSTGNSFEMRVVYIVHSALSRVHGADIMRFPTACPTERSYLPHFAAKHYPDGLSSASISPCLDSTLALGRSVYPECKLKIGS